MLDYLRKQTIFILKIDVMSRYIVLFLMFCCGMGLQGAGAQGIPTVYITTADGEEVVSKEEWKEGTTLRIVMPDGSVVYESERAAVRGRGHSTFTKPKKPYAIKLEKKSGLLGMAPGKRWVLLANFMDHSLMRNSLAFSMAALTELEWTPDWRFVNVVYNGQSRGCYLLCEQVRVGDCRVDIDEKEGYLLEVDSYFDEPCRFRTARRSLPVNVKAPDDPSPEQMAYIEGYLNEIESLLYGDSTDFRTLFRDYLDVDSFVDWWLVHELAQNAEPNGPRSCYMYKDKGGLLKAGPVWDFDLAFITVGLDAGGDIRPARLNRPDVVTLTGDSLYNRQVLWYDRLFDDSVFCCRVRERWTELSPRFRALADSLDRWQALIGPSALADERLWGGKDPARFDNFATFEESAANLKRVYLYRIDALDRILKGERRNSQ